jgi:hypothetical protein
MKLYVRIAMKYRISNGKVRTGRFWERAFRFFFGVFEGTGLTPSRIDFSELDL